MDVLLTRPTARAGLKLLLGLAMALAVGLAMASEKRGVGLKDRNGASQLQALKVSWYYTWTPQPMADPVSAKFVPMVWGALARQPDLCAARQACGARAAGAQ